MVRHYAASLLGIFTVAMNAAGETRVVTYPGPKGERPCDAYAVTVDGRKLFVYRARVRERIVKPPKGIWTHKLAGATQWASLAYFDFSG